MIEQICRLLRIHLWTLAPTDCHFPICHSLKYPRVAESASADNSAYTAEIEQKSTAFYAPRKALHAYAAVNVIS